MAALPEDEQAQAPDGSPLDSALAWAAERFGFDPDDRRQRQRGVEDLQKWLIGQGVETYDDGILGPRTLDGLLRTYDAERLQDSLGVKRAGESARQSAAPQPEPAPEPSPASTADAASARPVALSDSAISDIGQDRLGFRPYVEAVAEFILAEQTRPPLAIAINARWGQGKTSFMNMLDAQLKTLAPQTTTRVATTWFNPWKYSEPEQVWAAFVANVTRCLRDNLTREQSWSFRWDRFREKLRRHGDLSFWLRVLVAAAFLSIVASLALMDWAQVRDAVLDEQTLLRALYDAGSGDAAGYLWYVPALLSLPLALLLAYVALANRLGLNLLDYVEKTDFRDKIGTLSQFEHEMRRLADAVPDDLKVVVFIDDLDRCKGKVLGEIIEALQLADVSRACIFVMGMDLQLVAGAIERERGELALSAADAATRMEHGRGYKFLEKIIQARLSLPAHDTAQMEALVSAAMQRDDAPASRPAGGESAAAREGQAEPAGDGLAGRLRKGIGLAPREARRTPGDSDAVIEKARHYGSRHFDNPRRLKRFINGFRLQTYLAAAVRPDRGGIDHLARFIVLAEKWPAVLDHLLANDLPPNFWRHANDKGTGAAGLAEEIRRLPNDELLKLVELLEGPGGNDPLPPAEIRDLADWCGFAYYRGIAANA